MCKNNLRDSEEYKGYEKVLRVNMKKEGVDGEILGDLDKNDLHRFGVVSIKHKVAIMKEIKRVTGVKMMEYTNEGGNDNNAAPTAYI